MLSPSVATSAKWRANSATWLSDPAPYASSMAIQDGKLWIDRALLTKVLSDTPEQERQATLRSAIEAALTPEALIDARARGRTVTRAALVEEVVATLAALA